MKRSIWVLAFMVCAVLRAQPAEVAAYRVADARIKAYEADHKREYFIGEIHDTIVMPDGTVSYLICPMQGSCNRLSNWIMMAHPDRGFGMQKNSDGVLIGVGTGPDGKYYGYGWFIKRVPDAAVINGIARPASLYDAQPPAEIAKAYGERERLLPLVIEAGYDPQTGETLVAVAAKEASAKQDHEAAQKWSWTGTVPSCVNAPPRKTHGNPGGFLMTFREDGTAHQVLYRPKVDKIEYVRWGLGLRFNGPGWICEIPDAFKDVTIDAFDCKEEFPCVERIDLHNTK
jgi:hypothetical protein